MARDLGARRLNATTNSLYRPVARGSNQAGNQIYPDLFPGGLDVNDLRIRINRWLDRDTNNDRTIDDDDQPQARIYLLRPGTGDLTEVLR